MIAPRSLLLALLLSLLFSAPALAQAHYAPYIADIEQRLDKTAQLYQQQKNDEARREVQSAYFEVFENLEGPIRINISARKSYEMESTFGDIRRMIAEGKPLDAVQARIDGLKRALREVEPVLDGGHRLVAEEQHTALSRDDIAAQWQESFRTIDDRLAQAVAEATGDPVAPEPVEATRARLGEAFADALLLDQQFDNGYALSLGWSPRRSRLVDEVRAGDYAG